MIQTICPECGSQMEIPVHYLNNPVMCVSCRKNFTAYPLEQASYKIGIENAQIPTENENRKVHSVDSVLSPQKREDSKHHLPSVILMLPSSLQQGSILGGWICFALGIVSLFFLPYFFLLYIPLFLASFILSIIAIAQRNIGIGMGLLLSTLIAPWLAMGLSLPLHANLSMKKEYKDLQTKKAQFEDKLESMKKFNVLKADFTEGVDSIGIRNRLILLSVLNDTDYTVSRAFFRGVLSIPERSIPLVDDTFNYQILGGIDPGEQADWFLKPNMFGEWARVPIHQDAEFTVTVIGLEGVEGVELFGDAHFSKYDQRRLLILQKKFNGN